MKNTIQTLLRLAFVTALTFSLTVSAEDKKPTFSDAAKELIAKIRPMMAKDRDGAMAAYLRGARELAKQFPSEVGPRAMMLEAASMSSDEKLKKKVITELAGLKEEKFARITDRAKAELKKMNAIGKPVEIEFLATDGRKVDLAKMKGKVVLLDFWATWCGPCVKELPNIKRVYNKYHRSGFEIVGISLDSHTALLRSFTLKNSMPWPQYSDGLGWKNHFAIEYGIRSIPTMWLIDKSGNLVDVNARTNLEGKVASLLRSKYDGTPSPSITRPIAKLRPAGSGTGFFISNNGYLVTNHHVVEGGKKFTVRIQTIAGHTEKAAVVVASDIKNDISLLKINGVNFPFLPITDSAGIRLGEKVFTIGYPIPFLLGKEPKYTEGSISSLRGIKDEKSMFQISVPIQPGNSGGPLITDRGNVVGITTSSINTKLVSKITNGSPPQLVNYAVKSSYIFSLINANVARLREPLNMQKPSMVKRERVDLIQECKKSSVQVIVYK